MKVINEIENRKTKDEFDNYVNELHEIIGSKIELLEMLMNKVKEYQNTNNDNTDVNNQVFDLDQFND